jgi:Ca-activated chloride channel homolog
MKFLGIISLILVLGQVAAHGQKLSMPKYSVRIVLDASLSMASPISSSQDGETRIAAASRALAELLDKFSRYGEINTSLSVYGSKLQSNHPDRCSDVQILVAYEPGNTQRLKHAISKLQPLGASPLSAALKHAADAPNLGATKKYIIVIADGGDSCGQILCSAFDDIDKNTDGIFIVGIDIDEIDLELFSCVPTFANASDYNEISQALERIFQVIKPY